MTYEQALEETLNIPQVAKELRAHGYDLHDFLQDFPANQKTFKGSDVLDWMGY